MKKIKLSKNIVHLFTLFNCLSSGYRFKFVKLCYYHREENI